MASEKNITMRQYNGADYDTLYPKTKVEQVEGAYTQQQILSDSTKTLFGLETSAVPDEAFVALKGLIDAGDTATIAAGLQIETGTYVGTGTAGPSNRNSLTFSKNPKIVIVQNTSSPGSTVVFIQGSGATYSLVKVNTGAAIWVTWSGNSVSWYNGDNDYQYVHTQLQLNESGVTYRWIAICKE